MDKQNDISLYIVFGCTVMLTLALIIVLFYLNYRTKFLNKERQLEVVEREKQINEFKAVVQAEENQKKRIANNLHDEIIPLLVVLGQNNEKHLMNLSENKLIAENLKKDRELIDQVLSGITEISLDLIPNVLLNYGLFKAIERNVRHLNNSENSKISLKINFESEAETLFSQSDQVQIYRIVLEVLNNLRKHAQYKSLLVTIDKRDGMLKIEFNHDGKGVSNLEIAKFTEFSDGLGLKSLKSRIFLLNAQIDYQVTEGKSSVRLTIPGKE